MMTIVAATNRPLSKTLLVAKIYKDKLEQKGQEVALCTLEDIPADIIHKEMYGKPTPAFDAFQQKYLIPTQKFLFIIPEYNGGFPGILKLMIDASDIPNAYHGKKAMLAGVASGRAGNLRGMDHLTGILNYLQITVLPNKLPISRIETLVGDNDKLIDSETLKAIEAQCEQFINF